ncbi:unnamed protein product [Gongylonema pulchrum]|uniref:Cyanocobalamin reductase (cyanide-eliminating) n=1 Tax=Gongylonema pulchrum TaxID=637853 RepID=A0A3P7LXH8_9BILA|nr:unnamed protein product [Gongylonema pulchrum]
MSVITRVYVVHDFDFLPNFNPKILMTACGHVAGAAYFYQPPVSFIRPYEAKSMGVSLHAKYGGHFAYRAVVIFPEVHLPNDFEEEKAKKVLNTTMEEAEVVELFNKDWQDGRYRDCGGPVERYSPTQLQYFSESPPKRWSLIAHWFTEDVVMWVKHIIYFVKKVCDVFI